VAALCLRWPTRASDTVHGRAEAQLAGGILWLRVSVFQQNKIYDRFWCVLVAECPCMSVVRGLQRCAQATPGARASAYANGAMHPATGSTHVRLCVSPPKSNSLSLFLLLFRFILCVSTVDLNLSNNAC
jgi:hypothetical protein